MIEAVENDPYPNFRLFAGTSPEIIRGMYQMGAVIDGKFHTIVHGSVSELGDGYFLNGIIENLRAQGCGGDFYIIANDKDKKFLLGEIGENGELIERSS